MKQTITITTQTYFEDMFYYLGWGLLPLGVLTVLFHWIVGLVMLFLGIVVVTTAYKVTIDVRNGKAVDYLGFLGMKLNQKVINFNKVMHVNVVSKAYSQQLNYRSLSTTLKGTLHSAFLVTDGESIFLGESKTRSEIWTKANALAQRLGVGMKNG